MNIGDINIDIVFNMLFVRCWYFVLVFKGVRN